MFISQRADTSLMLNQSTLNSDDYKLNQLLLLLILLLTKHGSYLILQE